MQTSEHDRAGGAATLLGVACGVAAGALWGLVFLVPALLHGFGPLEHTVGRYVAYGVISALLLAPRWGSVAAKIGRRDWIALALLTLAGNILYYLLLTSAVQNGGIAMTSLVIGFLPVTVTIIGARDRDAVPLSRLLPSLLFCAAAALSIGWQALVAPVSGRAPLVGLLCAIGALISWTGFAVGNSRCLGRLRHVSAQDWNLLTGLMTGLQALALIPVAMVLGTGSHSGAAWMQLAAVSVGIAVLSSIVGNGLWNRMSQLLPLTLVGQMILFETLFALIYGFLWEERFPTALEAAAFGFIVLSVLSCLAAHSRPALRVATAA